ncbi:hypothetical protein Plhal304r1_c003g0013451 [Plasmopara halstedii]
MVPRLCNGIVYRVIITDLNSTNGHEEGLPLLASSSADTFPIEGTYFPATAGPTTNSCCKKWWSERNACV